MSDFTATYSALEARMKIIDTIANNLANAQTTGFKRDFGYMLQAEETFDVGTRIDLSPGDMLATRNSLDVAVNGEGFFVIQTPDGVRYTRSGNFALDDVGDLVTKDGMKVLSDSDSPITVGPGEVAIQDNGVVTVDGNEVGALKLVTFSSIDSLEKEGLHRYKWNGAAEDVEDVFDPRVKSGYLEQSNVNAVDEMVHLMAAYRDFEAVQRTLRTLMTDMNARLIQELGQLS